MFEVTKAGIFREYEAKLTVADFKADAQKRNVREHWSPGLDGASYCDFPCEIKHGLVSARSTRGRSRWRTTPSPQT